MTAQEPEEVQNPYYLALSEERRAKVDEIVSQVQEATDAFDKNIMAVLGGSNFYVHQILLSYEARLQWLEQRLEELESKHRRHRHDSA